MSDQYKHPDWKPGDWPLSDKLVAANERIAALEVALRGMVGKTPLDANGYCFYCGEQQWFSQRHGYKPESHAPDCPVAIARALLGEDGHG